MDVQTFLAFISVSFALAMTPGADWAYAISAGLGRYRVPSAVAGLSSGYVFHTALIVLGMAAVVASRPQLLSWLTLAGAAYLLWLGINTSKSWRSAGFNAEELKAKESEPVVHGDQISLTSQGLVMVTVRDQVPAPAPQQTRQRFFGPAFFRGLGTSGTNPKALLLYLALIPQFVDPDDFFSVPVQTAILGTSHMVLSIFIYTGVALGARVLLRQRPAAARFITLASGLIMIGLGILLVIEQAPALLESILLLMALLGH